MSKQKILNVEVNLNLEAVRAAASNATSLKEMAIEVPVVDPKELSIDDQIFSISLLPIEDDKKKTPDTSVYAAIKPVLVETLSGRAKPGFITVNGTIDIPKEAGKIVRLEECFFSNQEHAKSVCRVITEVELDRVLERVTREQKNADFLKNQLENDRF